MIGLDNNKVKSKIEKLEEELEGMFTKYDYMDNPIKTTWRNLLEITWKLY